MSIDGCSRPETDQCRPNCGSWAIAAEVLYVGLTGSPMAHPDGSFGPLVAGLAAGLYALLNHLLLTLALHLARGHSWRETLLFDPAYFLTDAMLSCMGVLLVLLWHLDPWSVTLVAAPLFLTYRGLRTPKLEEEARTDSKTGLYNARHLQVVLHEELRRAARFD